MAADLNAGYRLGIVNPLTLVGNEVKTLLHDRGIPYQKITLLSSLEDEKGALTELDDEPAVVQPISNDELDGLDLVFFCGPGDANLPWIELAEQLGFIAVDLSQPSSMAAGHYAVSGVNDEEIAGRTGVLISPGPIATPLSIFLGQLLKSVPIELCVATVIQPASESGQGGVEELMQQTISVFNMTAVPQAVFDRQLAFNLYPAQGMDEEIAGISKRIREVIGDFPLAISVLQGTLFHGHSFSLFLQMRAGTKPEDLAAALRGHPAIEVNEDAEGVSTVDAAGRDQILVSTIRADASLPGSFWVWMVSDNLRRGSALNAVLAAETVLARIKPILQ